MSTNALASFSLCIARELASKNCEANKIKKEASANFRRFFSVLSFRGSEGVFIFILFFYNHLVFFFFCLFFSSFFSSHTLFFGYLINTSKEEGKERKREDIVGGSQEETEEKKECPPLPLPLHLQETRKGFEGERYVGG
ncbi:hypothetical protein F4809DRAFT_571002 [Biscogniauxia mediterranea]|nr:hypothetical protein F4809DRAFT_571002 [Biscogniauxia mediterranea]